ncbi:MAG TPA: hypothetical protein GXX55_06375 [Firmicutes bacterium]|nr:hypothetical protein [Bacillota bacterium]
MRITPLITRRLVERALADHAERNRELTARIASGRNLLYPHDSPERMPELLRLDQVRAAVDGYRTQAAAAKAWLDETDAALGRAGQLLLRVRELVVLAASDTLNEADRTAIGTEIDQIREEMQDIANGQYNGSSLFGDVEVQRVIAPGVTVVVNVKRQDVFGGAGATTGDQVLPALDAIIAHLDPGDPATGEWLRTEGLAKVDAAIELVARARAKVGARSARVERTEEQLQNLKVRLESNLADTDGFDLAAALTELRQQEATYEATLMVTARLERFSLVDWLR